MSTTDALKKVLVETLESKGIVDNMKAKLRSEIFKALDDPTVSKPKLSNENLLINELIREYLTFNNYKHTESVLVAESGHPDNRLNRQFLCQELNIKDTESSYSVPLLYSLVNGCSDKMQKK